MIILKYAVIILAVVGFGFMAFDGGRALVKGDYIRPSTGEYAGQLGPWTKVVQKTGIDPESTLMKAIFLVWGLTGLFFAICFGLNYGWAWKAMLIISICSLWYLWMGTLSSLIQIILLIMIRLLR